jgi:hypothetical protein
MELSREEQPNKMRTGGGAAGEDEGGGRSSRICIRVRDAVGDGEHRMGEELGRKTISFFYRTTSGTCWRWAFLRSIKVLGPTILFPVFPHAEWGSLGEILSDRGHGCSFIYAYVLIFFF